MQKALGAFFVWSLLVGGLPPAAAAQHGDGPVPVMSLDEAGRKVVRAVRLSAPLDTDGRLDEEIYRSVPAISDFVQTLPKESAAPTERTEVWVMFDDHHIYVTARCWDSAPPDQWIANEIRRDSTHTAQNDHFGMMFDTFHDSRNGYAFYANPLGAFSDYTITDEGNANRDWNPVWDVRTGRFDGGWTVEMAIPFKSLRYKSGRNQTWGLQVRRAIRRKNEWIYLNPVPPSVGGPQGFFRVSAAGTLVGLDLPTASKNIEIKPYGISRLSTDRIATPPMSNDLDGDAGVDAKIGITANLTADLTYNTDFAQVEIDEQQVNLTRFSLFFPEKREFFLEGRGIFDFGRAGTVGGGPAIGAPGSDPSVNAPQLFYSRRIGLHNNRVVPLEVGGRLTGKVGGVGLGLVNIQTDDEPVSGTPTTNFTAIRVKRDILRRSSVGAIFTNRSHSVVADGSNQALGVDGAFSFFQDMSFGGYYARTRTPGMDDDAASYQGRFDYGSDRYGARLEYLHVGDNFNPEVGFVRRDNFNRVFGLLRFAPRPRSRGRVRRYLWEANVEYLENGAGALETRQETGRFNVEFESSDQITVDASRAYELLVVPFEVSRGVSIGPGGYTFSDVQLNYLFGQQRRASGSVSVQRGQFYDGTITSIGYSGGRVSVTKQLSVEPNISINRVQLPAGDFTSKVIRARTDYGFSPRTFASALLQYSSADAAFSTNLRFRWEYRPGSELFVVYTDERGTLGRGVPQIKNRTFVVKINRLLQF